MGKFAKLFEKLIKKYAIQFLKSKKDETITKWNKKIDLPLLNEKDEKELLEGLWNLVEDTIDDTSTTK